MKTTVALALAAVLAFGSPAVMAQQAGENAVDDVQSAEPGALSQRPDQILYKGVVGNLLEAVPMDAEKRVELQRGNAVVSAPLSARSIALLLGITNPVVMIGGLIWGIWSASRIESPAVQVKAGEEIPHARVDVVDMAVAVAGD